MAELIVNSAASLSEAIGSLRESWDRNKYLRVIIRAKTRSLSQNDISHVWYDQVAAELREDTPLQVKAFCKLHFGVPILRAADSDFRAFYDAAIKGLTYAQKLKAMEYLPVTSLMSVEQGSEYLVAVQDHYSTRNVKLVFPEKGRRAA